ncbi:MAG: hypothetical protein HYV04_04300 [Deltaproteobacteria bacterium]|nr:hypothetical protein [Deltaproteobacteria bacterium]
MENEFEPGSATIEKEARVVLLLSQSAAGLSLFLSRSRQPKRAYRIVGALTTAGSSRAIPILDRWAIPWRLNDIHAFHRSRAAGVRDLTLRPEFDRQSLDLIADFRPTHLALYGYLYILSRVVLESYPWRILSLRDGDLTICDEAGRPRYRGLHATRDAVVAGEDCTFSCVHYVTEEVDAGPVLIVSRPYPVRTELVATALELGARDALKAYARAQREWMMRYCWPAMLDAVLEFVGRQEMAAEEERPPFAPHEGILHE